MKKTLTITIGILLIAGLTGLRLYKKHQKAEIRAEQETFEREAAKKILQQQKEAELAKFEEEQKRRNDSIANAQQLKMNEGLYMLKDAMENLEN